MPWQRALEEHGRKGLTLFVEEVLGHDFLRTRIRASSDGDGVFHAIQGASIQWMIFPWPWQLRRLGQLEVRPLRVRKGEPIYLMCRRRHWNVGDAIPTDQIVYRYEL